MIRTISLRYLNIVQGESKLKRKTAVNVRQLGAGFIFAAFAFGASAASAAAAYEVQTPSGVNESAPWKAADKAHSMQPVGAHGATGGEAHGEIHRGTYASGQTATYPTSIDESRPWVVVR